MPQRSRKKIGRPPIKESCVYAIEIVDWGMPYHFSVNRNKKVMDGPFWEHVDLQISGKFIHPEKLSNKTISVHMLGSRKLVSLVKKPEKYGSYEPNCVGGLTVRGDHGEFIGSIPFDALHNICLLLQAEQVKYLMLSGPPLYRWQFRNKCN